MGLIEIKSSLNLKKTQKFFEGKGICHLQHLPNVVAGLVAVVVFKSLISLPY